MARDGCRLAKLFASLAGNSDLQPCAFKRRENENDPSVWQLETACSKSGRCPTTAQSKEFQKRLHFNQSYGRVSFFPHPGALLPCPACRCCNVWESKSGWIPRLAQCGEEEAWAVTFASGRRNLALQATVTEFPADAKLYLNATITILGEDAAAGTGAQFSERETYDAELGLSAFTCVYISIFMFWKIYFI